jgi:hypothetical protein
VAVSLTPRDGTTPHVRTVKGHPGLGEGEMRQVDDGGLGVDWPGVGITCS